MIETSKIKTIIDELIELSNTKYGLVKVGHDTLNVDVVFIEKFTILKSLLEVDSLGDVDFSEYPNMKSLIDLIKKINQLETESNQNKRMNKAINAYKK